MSDSHIVGERRLHSGGIPVWASSTTGGLKELRVRHRLKISVSGVKFKLDKHQQSGGLQVKRRVVGISQ